MLINSLISQFSRNLASLFHMRWSVWPLVLLYFVIPLLRSNIMVVVVSGIVESLSAKCKLSKASLVLKYSLTASLLQKQIYQPCYQIQWTFYLELSLFIELYPFIQMFYWMPGSILKLENMMKDMVPTFCQAFQRKYFHIWEKWNTFFLKGHIL